MYSKSAMFNFVAGVLAVLSTVSLDDREVLLVVAKRGLGAHACVKEVQAHSTSTADAKVFRMIMVPISTLVVRTNY